MSDPIQKYDHHSESLMRPPAHKINKLVELKNLKQVKEGLWKCYPIPGYNTRTYTIELTSRGWHCNCQGFNKNLNCSHVQALLKVAKEPEEPIQKELF